MMMRATPDVKFAVIDEMLSRDNNLLSVQMLCSVAGVSRSGYYRWISQKEYRATREQKDLADFALIKEAFDYRGYKKGVRGIHMRLLRRKEKPVLMNLKKIRRLKNKFGLVTPFRQLNPYKQMAKARKEHIIAPNLLAREFTNHGIRSVILTDITYLKNATGKFSYHCVMMDAFTKEVLGSSLNKTMEEDFVLACAKEVIKNYGHELSVATMIHSDQGPQYTSNAFADIVKNASLRRSMSRKANCWDNAPQESFFGHMKDEVAILPTDTHEDIVKKVTAWIDYYNTDRPQWGLGKLTPREVYLLERSKLELGALPPNPQGLSLCVSKRNDIEKNDTLPNIVSPTNLDWCSGCSSAEPYPPSE